MPDMTIEGSLVLRSARNADDIDRCAEFNARCNNAYEGATYAYLHKHFPGIDWRQALFVEDTSANAVVATTCLIPWEFSFGGVTLKAAQLEMVLAHPEYRKRGLVRQLINRFMDELPLYGFDVSFIWGIPFYYRQYGYTYCHYGNMSEVLPALNIPDDNNEPATFRRAVADDAPALARLYDAYARRYQLHVKRGETQWRYQINDAKHPVWITGDADNYVTYWLPNADTIRVYECCADNFAAASAVLQHLKRQTNGMIYINGPSCSPLAKLARDYSSKSALPEQWLLKITDIPMFFTKLAPVFEQRLRGSDCAGYNGDLIINLYKQAFRLTFNNGALTAAEGLGFKDYSMGADGGDLCIPADAFTRLALGFRTLDTLTDAWPDIVVKTSKRYIVEALFPVVSAHVHAPYHYMGPIEKNN